HPQSWRSSPLNTQRFTLRALHRTSPRRDNRLRQRGVGRGGEWRHAFADQTIHRRYLQRVAVSRRDDLDPVAVGVDDAHTGIAESHERRLHLDPAGLADNLHDLLTGRLEATGENREGTRVVLQDGDAVGIDS